MSLLPTRYDLTAWRGATFTLNLTLREGENEISPPRNLTGYTARFVIRKPNRGDVLLNVTTVTPTDYITLGGNTGTIAVTIADETTETFNFKGAVYELFLTDSIGQADVLIWGSFKVKSS